MQFTKIQSFPEYRFAIGLETTTQTYYLSIPVSNGLVEYSEYYAIPKDWAEHPVEHIAELRVFAEKCRNHEMDERLLQAPGRLRGEPI